MEEGDSITDKYHECLRNHAASLGSYATDGCGEFTPDDDPSSSGGLSCAACGCHRNFHRKVVSPPAQGFAAAAAEIITTEYGGSGPGSTERCSKKRFRTKFTAEQKEKMLAFAGKLGWRLQRKDEEDEIERFCRGVGISRKVFKVWMHNHKNCTTGNASSGLTDQS